MQTSIEGLSFGIVDGRPLFVDLSDDSYFLLDAEDEAEFLAGSGAALRASGRLRSALGPSGKIEEARCPRPDRSLLDVNPASGRPRIGDIAKAAMLVRAVRRSLARDPIDLVLRRLPGERDRDAAGHDRQAELAASFAAARRWVPVKPNCLLDSIALLLWLGQWRQSASLVFGAKLAPFAAHCWVQTDTHLLSDRAEYVGRFEPVRVIRWPAATR